jgi:hypothetical protein
MYLIFSMVGVDGDGESNRPRTGMRGLVCCLKRVAYEFRP